MKKDYIISRIHLSDIASRLKVNGRPNLLTRSGSYSYFTCPNCGHEKGFAVNAKSYGKCYHCGFYAANSVDYYMKVTKNFNEYLAIREIENLFGITENGSTCSQPIYIEANNDNNSDNNGEPKNDPKILNEIYSLFSESSKYINRPKLSKNDYDYLLSRNLSDEEIVKYGFFTCPTRGVMSGFTKELLEKDLLGYLNGTPGFYYDLYTEEWKFNYSPAIMIPIKNEFGEIIAIQQRNLFIRIINSKPSLRYMWFSSNSQSDELGLENGYAYGSGTSSPLCVLMPEYTVEQLIGDPSIPNRDVLLENSQILVIVEGFLKGIRLKKLGYNVISVQGVYSAKSNKVEETILNICKLRGININTIIIYFDADMQEKFQVIDAAMKITTSLYNKYKILFATWDINVGKGIDDFFDNGGKYSDLEFIPYKTFKDMVDSMHYECKICNIQLSESNRIMDCFVNAKDKYFYNK